MEIKKEKKGNKSELSVQNSFFKKLKEVIPQGIGLAEELADLLDVSIDSAYRRIRGETDLTIDEIYKITKKYAISIDDVFSNRSDTVTFAYTKLTDSVDNFEAYLSRIEGHLKMVNQFPQRKLYYVAEEIPIFYSFFSKKFIEFKLFYWQRSVLNVSDYQQQKFEYGFVPQNLIDIAYRIFQQYLTVPSTEIWTVETVLTGLRQIKFYFDSGIVTRDQAIDLMEEYKKLIGMVQKNAENARKNISDEKETYLLYSSEVVLGTNCIYILMGDSRYSYISFNTLNSLTTNNPEFCEETEHWIRNLEKKSTLISGVAEKQRYQFFTKMYNQLDAYINAIKAD
jgi:transcriptional regulator with XRE-family HTH domain